MGVMFMYVFLVMLGMIGSLSASIPPANYIPPTTTLLPVDASCLLYIDSPKAVLFFPKTGVLCIRGSITEDTANLFNDTNPKLSDIKMVVLNSPGGSVGYGIRVAIAINKLNIPTYVPATASCISICVSIFASGSERFIGPSAVIGIHFVYKVKDGELYIYNRATRDIYLGSIHYFSGADLYSDYIKFAFTKGFIKVKDLLKPSWKRAIMTDDNIPFVNADIWWPKVDYLKTKGLVTKIIK